METDLKRHSVQTPERFQPIQCFRALDRGTQCGRTWKGLKEPEQIRTVPLCSSIQRECMCWVVSICWDIFFPHSLFHSKEITFLMHLFGVLCCVLSVLLQLAVTYSLSALRLIRWAGFLLLSVICLVFTVWYWSSLLTAKPQAAKKKRSQVWTFPVDIWPFTYWIEENSSGFSP